MPLTTTAAYKIAANADFRGRVAVAMYVVAREVLGRVNPEDQEGAEGAPLRREFANHVARTDPADLMNFSGAVITNPTIWEAGTATSTQDQVPDSALLNAVRGMWSALANANLTTQI